MKIHIIVFLTSFSLIAGAADSPNKEYSTEIKTDEFNTKSLVINYNNKEIFYIGSGYGGFKEVVWSSDSRYLAVVDHGIKTMMLLDVYELSNGKVSKLDLPDYRLNILGRSDQFEGGRYWFDKGLRWKGTVLTFETSGSLKDGVSNPNDDPDNWYKYSVSISFGGKNTAAQPRLVNMKDIMLQKNAEQGAAPNP